MGVILIRFPSGSSAVCVVDGEPSFVAPSSWVGGDGDCAREGLAEVGGEPEESPVDEPAGVAGF